MAILAALVLVGVVGVALGCQAGADPEIVETVARDGLADMDHTVWVDCTVRNRGASGSIAVFAELLNGGYWKARQVVDIAEDGEKMVTFAFPDALGESGFGAYRHKCHAR